jgi:hypothetical protein
MRIAFPLLLLAACGSPAGSPEPVNPAPAPEPMQEELPAEPVAPDPEAEPAPPPAEPPPWSADPVAARDVPRVYLDEHRKAENRETCPLMVLTEVDEGARPRRANFSGGWAVAYDKKGMAGTRPSGEACADCGRSAFGVAGAGVEKGGGPAWPREIVWSDGSRAGYGPEGGDGPQILAFVEAADAGCLYNVWSAVGEDHLVSLIRGLRRVAPK